MDTPRRRLTPPEVGTRPENPLAQAAAAGAAARGRWLPAPIRWLSLALLGLAVAVLWAWSSLAIHYSNLPGAALRTASAATFALGWLAAFALLPRRGRTTLWFLASFALVVLWYWSIPASLHRDWAPEYSVLPAVEFHPGGDVVTVRSVRDFDYRTADDFTERWDDRTYDLRQLRGVDVLLSYWDGNRDIAHSILSFGFDDDAQLVVSVETRRERGEGYSTIAGLFKQFELIYLLGDERDIVRVRTDFRGEKVFLYPMKATPAEVRQLLIGILERVDELAKEPEWYSELADNCTTSLIMLSAQVRHKPIVFDIRMLLNGWLDQMMYERHRLVADASDGLPYAEMRQAHELAPLGGEHGDSRQFSARLRAKLPKRTD